MVRILEDPVEPRLAAHAASRLSKKEAAVDIHGGRRR